MHSFIEIFPKFAQIFPKIVKITIWLGMPLVSLYHSFATNLFFNTAFENAQGLEKTANILFIPIQYLLEGQMVYYDRASNTYILKQRFQYKTYKKFYSPLAFSTLPSTLILGTLTKSIAYLSPKIRVKHQQLRNQITSSQIISNNTYYRSLGMQVESFQTAFPLYTHHYQRRPGDENNLSIDKKALHEIVNLLYKKEIPFWVDCGTCLGAYRYGGVIPWDNDLDLAIIQTDFDNVMHALNQLDKKKYIAQDWSNRCFPKTYIRVYIKSNRNHIDIYTNAIDSQSQTLTNILSYGESNFMAESWKIRERMFGKPVPFNVIFPLKKAVFDGVNVPVPNKTKLYLTYKYGPNIEPVKIYNEKTKNYEKDLSHPYWMIPLVH